MTTEQSEQPTKKTWEVQYSFKRLNFTTTVQATDEEEAIALAGKLDFDQFTTRAKNEEVNSLEEIFQLAGSPRAERVTRMHPNFRSGSGE
jgi:hypothetical protein